MTLTEAKELLKSGLKSNTANNRQLLLLAMQIVAGSWGKQNGQQNSNTTGD